MVVSKFINEMRVGDSIQCFFLIKAVDCKLSNNNKKYLDFTLVDKTGEINAKLWDCSPEDEANYVINKFIKVKGTVIEWQGNLQIRIDKIRLVKEEDGIKIEDYIPSAPYSGEYLFNEVMKYIDRIKNEDLYQIVTYLVEMKKAKLLIYPAAMKNHHSIRSGLLYHIVRMLYAGDKLSDIYNIVNKELLFAGIILHDIAKIEEYDANELGIVSDYNAEGQLLGHIIQGITMIDNAANYLGIDSEIAMLLKHMILTHHYEPEYGSPKKPMIPEAEMLHYLDVLDARMYDMEKALSRVEPAGFSERIWSLDNRKIYKSKFNMESQ
ncbi:MAG TPA: HD domain-containing protein [Clostridiaceae bacterium]|nr:HD domain-containing protein [Clostridiaceae bacterium]